METNADNRTIHAREVFMVRRPRSPLVPLEAPDIKSSDESESNISPFIQGHDGETKNQKQARERKNKLKQGCQRRARQRKEAWIKYESDLAEYNRRRSEQEVEERRAANTPYNRIREALEELEATSLPGEKQKQLRDLLWSTALRIHLVSLLLSGELKHVFSFLLNSGCGQHLALCLVVKTTHDRFGC
jgi:hypothetical protein